ncbi:prepilin-type N-terminal cleavage/methylation domain-containing protein [Candidatus Saccharibacteria bacterium]|nr:prepilin-type N-terminal cleavage/methylation domain-containing protein [Candidatus Saccharibacteria bacterium]
MFKRNQRGDTIVEVLISLAVLGMIVGGAYSIVNAALRNSRQAQERSEATKIAESQVETIKAIPNQTGRFCFNGSAKVAFSETPPADYLQDDYASYPDQCKNLNGIYNVFVDKTDQTYTVTVRWDRIGGGKEQAQLVYRGYQE